MNHGQSSSLLFIPVVMWLGRQRVQDLRRNAAALNHDYSQIDKD